MDRRTFIKNAGITGLAMVTLKDFASAFEARPYDDLVMPVMFVGHGNPMNAIEDNEFSRGWKAVGGKLPAPKAILCISAHWLTKGTKVTAMEKPPTIHDFGGFPKELHEAQYPAPGAKEQAELTKKIITTTTVEDDFEWGLDHGTWSVLMPMYPNANIPVYQLSIDYTKGPEYHYQLAAQLRELRKKGILIIGSGNIVHNLRLFQMTDKAYDWAIEFDEKVKELIKNGDHDSLIHYEKLGQSAKLSIPTNEHYLPLLYTLGLQEKNEQISFFNEKATAGSVSMTSVIIQKQ